MKYRVTLEDREREIDVTLTPDGRAIVSLDGAPVDVDVERVGGGLSLRIGASVYDVALSIKPDETQLAAGAARTVAQVQSPRTQAKRGARSLGGGDNEMRAPMPGRIVKVLIAAGSEITAGEPCIVIEAMKMENELRAPRSGKVRTVHVTEGTSVEGRALLVTLE